MGDEAEDLTIPDTDGYNTLDLEQATAQGKLLYVNIHDQSTDGVNSGEDTFLTREQVVQLRDYLTRLLTR